MSLPFLGKGFIVVGSVISPSLFGLLQLQKQPRLIETVGKITGDLSSETWIFPRFKGWRMKEGASGTVGSLAYSYGYVARISGTETATSGERKIQNETTDMKGIQDGELTLIETKWGSLMDEDQKTLPAKRGKVMKVVGGYTNKKFLLIGVGKTSNQIEFRGLISIVKDEGPSQAKCWREFKENEKDKSIRTSINSKFSGSGLLLSNTYGIDGGAYSKQGRALVGNCAKEFFKGKSQIPFIEQLKGDNDKQVGFQELNIEGGMSIAISTGMKKESGKKEDIIAPGIMVKNKFDGGKGKTLWVGLQGDGIAKTDSQTNGKQKRKSNQGWMAILDWESTKSEENLTGIYGGTSEVKKIDLDQNRKYYLWDPSFTRIKGGKLITKNEKELPFKLEIGKFVETKLIK
ncbi:hypothetical protein WEN_03325 [Mycoplasma wenyonii str. Massachusetts]|uniref:Uncharacterized protein n=1 Tax=Mycoplasma wenyonii (strain Massachusetts) TaxID=1197325 RepID=I6ZFN8_MYCWM|nr:hypothetical protein [Mycoplasma wenyonii]AFN65442.1 hypothetical protein WEN_03325 [Mycoplasma wenyonii str. Massachusetts]